MRAAKPEEVMPPNEPAGARERGASPWLGGTPPPSETFTRYQNAERALQALAPTPTSAVSPATSWGAFADWATHLAMSPAKQLELAELATRQMTRWWQATATGNPWPHEPLPQDKRFDNPAWHQPPFAWLAQAFLMRESWWQCATSGVPGVTPHHERMVNFTARQWLDMVAPTNNLATNPEVLQRTLEERGANLMRGLQHALDDTAREAANQPPAGAERFKIGKDVAATPGRVVLRNRLMELIQYDPRTPNVHPEPVLIVPAWIMKYYVLDLEPHNSMVKFLVDRGFTVFAISWKNPTAEDRDLGLDDYHRLGVRTALDTINRAAPDQPVHAVGYCLGGTLLSMVAAVLGRERSKALKTVTLLAAQTDFSDPGELSLFIDESQVHWLEGQMARQGFLDKTQMRATFQMLRSRDLVWSYRLATYLLGDRTPMSALMAWNADGTRLPQRMHSEYLRALYLDNALAHGEFRLGDVPISLADIRVPIFNVGTVQDHVAPWRSVFKLHQFTEADQTFVLTAGGHNVGIVNPPGQPKASHRLGHWKHGDRLITPDEWLDDTPSVEGSWWTPWAAWLAGHSAPSRATPPTTLHSLGPAPGQYVCDT